MPTHVIQRDWINDLYSSPCHIVCDKKNDIDHSYSSYSEAEFMIYIVYDKENDIDHSYSSYSEFELMIYIVLLVIL